MHDIIVVNACYFHRTMVNVTSCGDFYGQFMGDIYYVVQLAIANIKYINITQTQQYRIRNNPFQQHDLPFLTNSYRGNNNNNYYKTCGKRDAKHNFLQPPNSTRNNLQTICELREQPLKFSKLPINSRPGKPVIQGCGKKPTSKRQPTGFY